MRLKRLMVMLAIGAALAGGASLLRAQSACRGQCDIDFRDCKESCTDAQNFDQCVSKCQKMQRECLENCD